MSDLSDLSDDTLPVEGLFPTPTKRFDPKRHEAGTRRGLAVAALCVLVVFYCTLLLLFTFDVITLQEMTSLIAAFSGLQTLTAVAFAFYFAKS